MMTHACRMIAAASVLALVPATAAAQQPQAPLEIQARKDCLLGRVDAGVEALAELFTRTNNPNFVYNQARCYEQNSKPAEAIQRFLEYQRIASDLSADERTELERHLRDCRATLAEQQKAPQPQPQPLQPIAPSSVTMPSPAGDPAPAPTQTDSPAPAAWMSSDATQVATQVPTRGSSLRGWGLALGAAGLLATGAGVAFSIMTKRTQDSVEDDARQRVYDPDKDARGRAYAAWQWVGYGVGAAGLIGGLTLYYLGMRQDSAPTGNTVAIVPFAHATSSGLLLQGGF